VAAVYAAIKDMALFTHDGLTGSVAERSSSAHAHTLCCATDALSHTRLQALGVNQVVVAVNKLDAAVPPWDEGRFESIKASVEPFLRQIGFKANKVGLSDSHVASTE
jgi:translation elongation factor EF-Tu-like GTPase